MNRREFFKTTALGVSAVTLAPTIALASNEVPLYKQFDWFSQPATLMFRIETYQDKRSLVCQPVYVRSTRLMLLTEPDVDLTQQTTVGRQSWDYEIERFGQHITKARQKCDFDQTYYTNEILLNEAKRLGITHIHSFVSYVDEGGHNKRWYIVRGVKKPDWKTVNGKLQVVEVDKDGFSIKV